MASEYRVSPNKTKSLHTWLITRKDILIKKLFGYILATTFLFASAPAMSTWTQPGQVTYINSYPSTTNFAVNGVGHECVGNTTNQFSIDMTAGNAKELYATLMFSMASGRQVAVNYTCNPNTGAADTTNIDIR